MALCCGRSRAGSPRHCNPDQPDDEHAPFTSINAPQASPEDLLANACLLSLSLVALCNRTSINLAQRGRRLLSLSLSLFYSEDPSVRLGFYMVSTYGGHEEFSLSARPLADLRPVQNSLFFVQE